MRLPADVLIAALGKHHAYVRRRMKSRVRHQAVDDVVQDTFIRAIRLIRDERLVVYEGEDIENALRGWLAHVAHHACLHYVRQIAIERERFVEIDADTFDCEDFRGPDPSVQIQAREELRIAVCRLSREERAIMSRVADGAILRDIADELRLPFGTVASRLSRVRRILKARREG